MTESPLAVLLMDWCEFSGTRDALVPKPPATLAPLGTGSTTAEGSAASPSFDSVSSLESLSPFFLTCPEC